MSVPEVMLLYEMLDETLCKDNATPHNDKIFLITPIHRNSRNCTYLKLFQYLSSLSLKE